MILGSRRRRSGGNSNVLTFWTTCDNTSTFDPKITGVDGIMRFDDGSVVAVASGVEVSKTFASGGLHWAKFYPGAGGLAAITAIDCNTDRVTAINMRGLTGCKEFLAYTNAGLVMRVSDFPAGLTYASFGGDPLLTGDLSDLPTGLTTAFFYGDPLLTGDLSDLLAGLAYAHFGNDPLLTGDLSDLPAELITAAFYSDPLLTGDLADLPAGLTYAAFYSDPLLEAASIAHLTKIQLIQIYSMGWLTADVDVVLLSIANAIVADAAHFTYATPALQIGGTNEAPSGTIGAATTSPLVTPGAGNSDADWLWVEGVSEHCPVSGCAAVYYMRNNPGHAWTVTITGEA